MTEGVPTKVIAASMGLAAFAVAIIAGLAADNEAQHILRTALGSMLALAAFGWLIGAVAERAAFEAIDSYRAAHPVAPRSTQPHPAPPADQARAAAA